jgi:hypothetical protein
MRWQGTANPGAVMSIQSFEFDDKTDENLNRLKVAFRVNSTAEVIRRAIALAEAASKYAGTDDVIVLSGTAGSKKIDLTR